MDFSIWNQTLHVTYCFNKCPYMNILLSWQRCGGGCPDVPRWGGSSLLSFEGGNCSSPSAPLLMEASSQSGHQLYPVRTLNTTTCTQILFTLMLLSTGFHAFTIYCETLYQISLVDVMRKEQSLSKFPQQILPKYTDLWACPDHTPALPRALARSLTNPRSQIPQQTSLLLSAPQLLLEESQQKCFWPIQT